MATIEIDIEDFCKKSLEFKLNYKANKKFRNRFAGTAKKKKKFKKEYNRTVDYYFKRNYGITFLDYKNKEDFQNNLCAICNKPEPKQNVRLSIDHNHETGEVRDLLCSYCNTSLGMLRENISIMENMIKYIKKWNYKNV